MRCSVPAIKKTAGLYCGACPKVVEKALGAAESPRISAAYASANIFVFILDATSS